MTATILSFRSPMPKGPRTCISDGHKGARELPAASFYGKEDVLCRRCRRRLTKDIGSSVKLTSGRRVEDAQPAEPEDEFEVVDPSSWDRARYWRWLVFNRYVGQTPGFSGRPVRGEDHRVDEAEIARFVNEAVAELATLLATRRERVAAMVEAIRTSGIAEENQWTDSMVRAVAAYRVVRQDVRTAIDRANVAADLGEEDPPAGAAPPPRKPVPSNVIPIRRVKT